MLFTGKERDAGSGLDYFGARYFSAAQGRFTSADSPFADQHVEDPQSWNLYSYVRNNPLRAVDIDVARWSTPFVWESEPLPNEAFVVRGGTNTPEAFAKGSGVTLDASGKVRGVSVNSAAGKSVAELSQGIPHTAQIGFRPPG